MKAKTNKTKKLVNHIIGRAKHHLKMAVFPHKKNNYRPHLVRRYGLIAIIFVTIGLQFGYNGATTGDVLGRQSDITISSLLEQTNLSRDQLRVPRLTLNEKLNQAAYLKARDMFARQYWAHNAPDGTQPWKWFGDVDYSYSEAGENLAKNFTSTNAVMTAWMNSPEHRANIVKNNYRDIGFAVVDGQIDGKPTSIVVALYGSPSEMAVAGSQTTFSEAASKDSVNIFTQLAIASQSITPVVIASLFIIGLAVVVSIFAHVYRKKLPKLLRQSWYLHHGMYKAFGLLSFAVVVVMMYGGGQI